MMTYLEPMKEMCPTCPFRKQGYTSVQPLLVWRAMMEGTPVCHSTGDSDVTPPERKIHKEDRACRGARNLQIVVMHTKGLLKEPTDECWKAKVDEMNAEESQDRIANAVARALCNGRR